VDEAEGLDEIRRFRRALTQEVAGPRPETGIVNPQHPRAAKDETRVVEIGDAVTAGAAPAGRLQPEKERRLPPAEAAGEQPGARGEALLEVSEIRPGARLAHSTTSAMNRSNSRSAGGSDESASASARPRYFRSSVSALSKTPSSS